MAFNSANLSYHSSMFAYRTWDYDAGSDTLATVGSSEYFAGGAETLRQQDMIRVTASNGKALYVVDGSDPSTPHLSILKLADGVTSFPA